MSQVCQLGPIKVRMFWKKHGLDGFDGLDPQSKDDNRFIRASSDTIRVIPATRPNFETYPIRAIHVCRRQIYTRVKAKSEFVRVIRVVRVIFTRV